jgi:hypothetical protein
MHELRLAVQRNCHISDARYAGEYSLCTYLLKMREYYRWEKGFGPTAKLHNGEVGNWVDRREQLWARLENDSFEPLNLCGQRFDPFDDDGINRELLRQGLVYSGGYGRFGKPHFFLARVLRVEACGDHVVIVSGEEYARDLSAPPAMTRGKTIFVRRESLHAMISERVEEWRWKQRDNAMARAMAYYDIEPDLERALDKITDNELETAILHELGELIAGELLGTAWEELLLGVVRTPAEVAARAVRDQLADCLSTLPALLALENLPAIHFYFANLSGMRKELSPGLTQAYQRLVESGDLSELKRSVPLGSRRWLSVARDLLELHRRHGAGCGSHVAALAEQSRL